MVIDDIIPKPCKLVGELRRRSLARSISSSFFNLVRLGRRRWDGASVGGDGTARRPAAMARRVGRRRRDITSAGGDGTARRPAATERRVGRRRWDVALTGNSLHRTLQTRRARLGKATGWFDGEIRRASARKNARLFAVRRSVGHCRSDVVGYDGFRLPVFACLNGLFDLNVIK